MSIRVTQNILNSNMLFNLQRNNKMMETYQDQLSTGKKINKPSDNPVTAVRGMFYRSSLNEIDQFKRNLDHGLSWMTSTDEALNEVTEVLQRVRELTVQGSNGTNDSTARTAIAEEINQLKNHLGEIANSQFSGKYIFAGTDVKNPPFGVDTTIANSSGEFINKNQEVLELEVGLKSNIQMNVRGVDIFNNQDIGGVFTVLSDIVDQFRDSNETDSNHLSRLDSQIDNILKERSELGARMNRIELAMSRMDGIEVSTTRLLSQEEDIDISQVIINLKAQENVQRAALSAGARIIQPSLVDFLR
jgi:flagellar hook-associated protein 3 FlgL